MDKIEIDKRFSGERIDKVLRKIPEGNGIEIPSRSFVKNIAEDILVNGRNIKGAYKLKDGDILEFNRDEILHVLENRGSEIISEKGDLDIVHEEKDFLIINKNKGIPTHPGVGNSSGTLANFLRYYLESKNEYDPSMYRSGIVHRLDKGVSGLMVVAKNAESQEFFKRQFENHLVKKIYFAQTEKFKESQLDSLEIVNDFNLNEDINDKWFTSEGYIGRDKVNRFRMEFKPYEFAGSKSSVSHFLKVGDESFFVKIDTGRMHQIRATFYYLGRYIQGDVLYKPGSRAVASNSIALESVYLGFTDMNGKERSFNIFSDEKFKKKSS